MARDFDADGVVVQSDSKEVVEQIKRGQDIRQPDCQYLQNCIRELMAKSGAKLEYIPERANTIAHEEAQRIFVN